MHDSGTACRIADAGIGAPNDDVELKNQLLYQKQRCAALASQRVDSPKVVAGQGRPDTTKTAHAAPPTPAGTGGAKELAKGFRVQVAAAPTQAKADQAAAKLRGASYAVVIARENGFFKVRSQAFATRAEAVAALVRIRGKLGGQPFVVADK